MIKRHLVVESLSGTELAVIADHAGLDCATAQKLDDAGDNAGMWKVYCLNPLMGLGQHFAAVQLGAATAAVLFQPIPPVRAG